MTSRPSKPEIEIPTLTPEQASIKTKAFRHRANVQNALEALHIAQDGRAKLEAQCNHLYIPTGNYEWNEWSKQWNINCGGSCAICSKPLQGWYCPKAPNHQCEYDEEDSCQDDCIHCHLPDERK